MSAEDLRHFLALGFNGASLNELSQRLLDVEERVKFPAAVLLTHFVCFQLSKRWDGPVTSTEADHYSERYAGLLDSVFAALESKDAEAVRLASDQLAKTVMSEVSE